MASVSETGHAKNVALFKKAISICTSFNSKYNPSNALITLAGLQTTYNNAEAALTKSKDLNVEFINATNARMQAFLTLRPLVTRIKSSLEASGATEEIVADAETHIRKLRGQRAKAIEPVNPADPPTIPTEKSISTSQLSYDSLVDHFDKLTKLVAKETKYAPNEADLNNTSLKTTLAALVKANDLVVNTSVAIKASNAERNEILYEPQTGLVASFNLLKKYVASVYGAAGTQHKQLTALQIRPSKS